MNTEKCTFDLSFYNQQIQKISSLFDNYSDCVFDELIKKIGIHFDKCITARDFINAVKPYSREILLIFSYLCSMENTIALLKNEFSKLEGDSND